MEGINGEEEGKLLLCWWGRGRREGWQNLKLHRLSEEWTSWGRESEAGATATDAFNDFLGLPQLEVNKTHKYGIREL